MSAPSCVSVSDEGVCTEVPIRTTRGGGLQVNRKPLTVHFHAKEVGVAIVSYHSIEHLQFEQNAPFAFKFPPPLNSYVYPTDVFVVAMSADGKVSSINNEELFVLCEELGRKAVIAEDEAAVYDVPAIPIQIEAEDANDEHSEEEEDEEDDEGEDDMEESEEDEWCEAEDDDSSATN